MEWTVRVEVGPLADEDLPHQSAFYALLEELADHGAAGGLNDEGWSVTLTVEGGIPTDVLPETMRLLDEAVFSTGTPMADIVDVQITEANLAAERLERSNFPDIVGVQEVLGILGVTKQRLSQLRGSGRFPEPMVELGATPVWLRPAVEAFVETWNRKPGRLDGSLWAFLDDVDDVHQIWFKRDLDHPGIGMGGVKITPRDHITDHMGTTTEKMAREYARRFDLYDETEHPETHVITWSKTGSRRKAAS
jgi:hypothetical protein